MIAVEAPIRYVAGGTVQAGDGVYVERASDVTLLQLCREGAFAYVLTTRQMGKSSLMIRTAEKLLDLGVQPVIVDLTELGAKITAEQWYRGFVEKVAEQLELRTAVATWWESNGHLSAAQRFSQFFAEVLIGEIASQVVIFIDEIDTTLRFDFTDDLFGSIRYLYNARATNRELARLSFVLLGVASPGDLMRDISRTPFNIGHRVELQDFTEDEAVKFLHPDRELVRSVLAYTNGHPYLTLRVLRSLADQPLEGNSGIEDRIAALFFGEQASKDGNLQFVRDMLTKRALDREAVLLRYRKVRRGKIVHDSPTDSVCTWLRLSGVVYSKGGLLLERNEIYRRVFDEGWIKKNRHVNWTRRAVWAAGLAAALLIVIAAILTPVTYKEFKNAEAAKLASQSLLDQTTRPAQIASTVLLAVESYRRVPGFDALQSLKNDLPLLRKTAAVLAHDAAVNAVVFSADGRWIATGSDDWNARVFDAFSGKKIVQLSHGCSVNSIAFSPAGNLLATASDDGTARVFATATWAEVARVRHRGPVVHAAFSPDGALVATASGDSYARIFRADNGTIVHEFKHRGAVNLVAFSPDGRRLATASDDTTARVFEISSGMQLASFEEGAAVNYVTFSADGNLLATASNDESARVFRLPAGKLVARIEHQDTVNAIAFSPDGQLVATASDDRTVRLVQIAPRVVEVHRFLHQGPVNSVVFSSKGELLATASDDRTAQVFNVSSHNELAQLASRDQVRRVAFSPDSAAGDRLAVAGDDPSTRVFEIASGQDLLLLRHPESVNRVAFSPNGLWVATASEDTTARLYDMATGRVKRLPSEALVDSIAFSPDSRQVAIGGDDKITRVFDVGSGKESAKLPAGSVNDIAFSSDGKWIATASSEKTAQVFDVASGNRVVSLHRHALVESIAFSPDRRFLAIGDSDGMLWLFETAGFTEVAHLKHAYQVNSIAFSKDGGLMATGSVDKYARVFEVGSWNERARVLHPSSVLSVDFGGADGRLLVTGDGDGVAEVSETRSGKPLARFAHQNAARSVAFSPDARFLGIAAGDTVTVTPWKAEDLVNYVCTHTAFNLTPEEWKKYIPLERYRKTCPNLP